MAEREAALAEQPLGLRAGDARAEDGFTGDLVEAHAAVEPAQVQRDDGAEVGRGRGRGRRPRWCRRRTAPRRCRCSRAVPQDRGDLVLGARESGPRRVRLAVRCPCAATDPGWTCRRRAGSRARSSSAQFGSPTTATRAARSRGTTPTDAAAPRRGSPPGRRRVHAERLLAAVPVMPSDNGLAAAGSPQAFHFIGGRGWWMPCVTVLHMLSISNAGNDGSTDVDDRILARRRRAVSRLRPGSGDGRRNRAPRTGQPAHGLPPLAGRARDARRRCSPASHQHPARRAGRARRTGGAWTGSVAAVAQLRHDPLVDAGLRSGARDGSAVPRRSGSVPASWGLIEVLARGPGDGAGRRQRARRRHPADGRHDDADRPVGRPVGPDGLADPRRRRTGRRVRVRRSTDT